jgi:hypothetical protein
MNTESVNRRDFVKKSIFTLAAAGTVAGMAAEKKAEPPKAVEKKAEDTPIVKKLIASAPILQNAAETSITVTFAVTADAIGWVEYSTSPDMAKAKRVLAGGTGLVTLDDKIAHVTLRGLKGATRYWYRIGADRIIYKHGYSMKNLGPELDPKIRSFETIGAAATGSFCVINDTHNKKDVLDKAFTKIAEIKPRAIIWNGDATNVTETKEQAINIFIHAHKDHPEYAAQTPLMFVNGNHDLRGRFARRMHELLPFREVSERSGEFFDLGRNFVQRLGDIALIGMDTGEDKLDTNPLFAGLFQMQAYREKQARWLAEVIESDVVKTAKYKIVFCHIPLFDPRPTANPGDLAPNDKAPGYKGGHASWQRTCAKLWGPSFERAGVQLVITAHQHRVSYYAPETGRSWAQIVGGGCNLENKSPNNVPTVIEGKVKDGKLSVTIHNLAHNSIFAEYTFV